MSIILVCGPPCAGKTTHALQYADTHLIVDHDLIAQGLGSTRTHNHLPHLWRKAERVMAGYHDAIEDGQIEDAVVVRCLPERDRREALAARLGADIVLLNPPRDVLVKRAQQRDDPAQTVAAIDQWLADHT